MSEWLSDFWPLIPLLLLAIWFVAAVVAAFTRTKDDDAALRRLFSTLRGLLPGKTREDR